MELREIKGDDGFAPVHATEAQLVQLNHIMSHEPGRLGYWLEGLRRGIAVGPLSEAIAPGDFPSVLGVAIQRDLQARYRMNVAPWRAFTKTGTVANFLRHEKIKVYGQDNELEEVPPGAPYPSTPSGTGVYYRQVKKYGRRFDILWESIINDGLGAFADIAQRFADAVVRTQSRHATEIYAGAAGPSASLFGAPIADVDGQNVTNSGVLPLTIANLQATIALMRKQTDPNGEPITVIPRYLVVPQSLEFTARSILTSALQQQAASAVPVPVANVIPQMGLQLVVDPYLEVVDASATADTTWYLFAESGDAAWGQMDFLAGNIGPDIRIKSSGSSADPMSGSFEDDSIAYRVRDVHGGAAMDPRFCYAQVGP